MADSLLHALLIDPRIGVQVADLPLLDLDPVKKQLLVSAIYDALNRDPEIMPLLTRVIRGRSTVTALFDALVVRIKADFERIR